MFLGGRVVLQLSFCLSLLLRTVKLITVLFLWAELFKWKYVQRKAFVSLLKGLLASLTE